MTPEDLIEGWIIRGVDLTGLEQAWLSRDLHARDAAHARIVEELRGERDDLTVKLSRVLAERDRLRGALERIATEDTYDASGNYDSPEAVARAALAPPPPALTEAPKCAECGLEMFQYTMRGLRDVETVLACPDCGPAAAPALTEGEAPRCAAWCGADATLLAPDVPYYRSADGNAWDGWDCRHAARCLHPRGNPNE